MRDRKIFYKGIRIDGNFVDHMVVPHQLDAFFDTGTTATFHYASHWYGDTLIAVEIEGDDAVEWSVSGLSWVRFLSYYMFFTSPFTALGPALGIDHEFWSPFILLFYFAVTFWHFYHGVEAKRFCKKLVRKHSLRT